jgi:hypothetical protein
VTRAQVRDPGGPPDPVRASPPALRAPAGADVLMLQRRAVARSVRAVLARAPTEVRNVELRTPPKRPKMRPAVERTTSAGMKLAEEIDAVDKLTDDELIAHRIQIAHETASAGNDADEAARQAAIVKSKGGADAAAAVNRKFALESAHEKLLRKLEAIEYVASWRRLPPLKADRMRYQETGRELANRRVNFRLLIEERVRKTGSLEDALDGLPADERDVQTIRKEAAQFRTTFKGRAWDNAARMLRNSQATMFGVMKSYGLPPELGERAVNRMHNEKLGEDAAAQFVLDEMQKLPDDKFEQTVNAKDPTKKRGQLVAAVKSLKPLQERVTKLKRVASGLDAEWNAQGSKNDAMARAIQVELPAAQRELAAAWMEAERDHQILAAFRGDEAELDRIDLAKLDLPHTETSQLMKRVLVRMLPKLKDNATALWMLEHRSLNPIAMPPVVALTSATMFIPEGSIRAGVVRDMLNEEKSSRESWLITLATIALAIITLIPSGGMSALLIPAGIASAGLAAYSALKIYEKYERQKLLVNTDLDLARSLSNEQPSLRGFAMNLVAAGLEGFALFRLWRKAVELRKLAGEPQSLRQAVDEFKLLMQEEKLSAQVSKQLLDDVVKATRTDAPKPPATTPKSDPRSRARDKPDAPATTKGGKRTVKPPPIPPPRRLKDFANKAAFLKAVRDKLGTVPRTRPPGWERVIEALNKTPGRNNKKIRAMVEDVMDALQDPKRYEEVLGDAWDLVAAGKAADINGALVKLAERTGYKVRTVGEVKAGDSFFKEVATKKEYWIDDALAGKDHGSMTHILQDLVVDKALGAGGSVEFRALLGRAEGTVERYVGKTRTPSTFTQLPDGRPLPNETFMTYAGPNNTVIPELQMATGDYVWRFTYDLFYENQAMFQKYARLPQPERLRPALNDIGVGLK